MSCTVVKYQQHLRNRILGFGKTGNILRELSKFRFIFGDLYIIMWASAPEEILLYKIFLKGTISRGK